MLGRIIRQSGLGLSSPMILPTMILPLVRLVKPQRSALRAPRRLTTSDTIHSPRRFASAAARLRSRRSQYHATHTLTS